MVENNLRIRLRSQTVPTSDEYRWSSPLTNLDISGIVLSADHMGSGRQSGRHSGHTSQSDANNK